MLVKLSREIAHLWRAAICSFKGLYAAFKHETAFRQECYLAVVLVPIGLYIGNNFLQKAMLLASIFLVLITELLNSAIEAIVDRFGSDLHELSARAKDLGSAAVFISLINLVVIWLLLLLL